MNVTVIYLLSTFIPPGDERYNIEGPIRSETDKRRRSGVECNVTERSRSAIYYSLMAPYVGLVVAESVGHPDHWSKRL